jgi:hypothetical protein
MKCYLCGKEIVEGELWAKTKDNLPYHIHFQDCVKKQKGE